MLSLGKDNCAVSESEVKVTPNATETGNRPGNTSPRFFIEPAEQVALNVKGSFEEGSGR